MYFEMIFQFKAYENWLFNINEKLDPRIEYLKRGVFFIFLDDNTVVARKLWTWTWNLTFNSRWKKSPASFELELGIRLLIQGEKNKM